jgi:hypothetical protein
MIMNKWLQKFFMYLDRYYVKHHSLPTLAIDGLLKFKPLNYDEVNKDVANAMLVIIDDERDGKDVDRDLLRQVVELFESMGMGSLDAYTADLEEPLLTTTREYYARKREEVRGWEEGRGERRGRGRGDKRKRRSKAEQRNGRSKAKTLACNNALATCYARSPTHRPAPRFARRSAVDRQGLYA